MKRLSELEKIKKELEKELEKKNKISAALSKLEDLRKNIDSALQKSRVELNNVNNKLIKVKSEKEGAKNSLWFGTRLVLEMRDLGKIKGIHGAVSELAKVKKENALALRIAAGPKLNYIVVDDEATAIKCINSLKAKGRGFTTFIPLNRMKSTRITDSERALVKLGGVVGFAKDIISCEQKYNPVFDYVFGSNLIVKDIDTAKKVGIGNANMITLEGDWFGKDFIISGGSRDEKSCGFNIKELEEEELLLERHKKMLEDALINLEKENKSNDNEILGIKERRIEVEKTLVSLDKRKRELSDSIKELPELNINEVKNKIKKLAEELEVFGDKPVEISDEKADSLENSAKGLRKRIEGMWVELKTGLHNVENLSADIKKMEKILDGQKKEKDGFQKDMSETIQKMNEKKKEIDGLSKDEKKFVGKYDDLSKEKTKLEGKRLKKIDEMGKLSNAADKLESKMNNLKVEKAGIVARVESAKHRFEEFKNVKIEKEIKESPAALRNQIDGLSAKIERFGAINEKALEAYKGIEKEFEKAEKHVNKITAEKESVLKMIEEIENKKTATFMGVFNRIKDNFKGVFEILSPGGWAEVILENEEEPLAENCGIDIHAKPRGKKVFNLRGLSGGEKTITALAFIFSIQEFEPAPFYLLDEVDAALDKENSLMLAKLITGYSRNAQYIMISHNDDVYSKSDNLYGVSLNKHKISQIVGIKLP